MLQLLCLVFTLHRGNCVHLGLVEGVHVHWSVVKLDFSAVNIQPTQSVLHPVLIVTFLKIATSHARALAQATHITPPRTPQKKTTPHTIDRHITRYLKVFTCVSTSAFLTCFSRVHCQHSLCHQVLQFQSLNEISVPKQQQQQQQQQQ